MLCPSHCLETLNKLEVTFYTGIPDSLLKEFCACLTDTVSEDNHLIAANEGAAVGLAIGNHIATGKIPLIYMQNSGLGNAINPLLSLASPDVYQIPLVLMIGWRGAPGTPDEPQHIHQGRVTLKMLEDMDIPHIILSDSQHECDRQIKKMIEKAQELSGPVALIVKTGTFSTYKFRKSTVGEKKFSRERAITTAIEHLNKSEVIVCTTGMASRELFELRSKKNLSLARDFLTVGGMGHASQIALGIAKSRPDEKVVCFDGDGAVLMHMGSLAIIGQSGCSNFLHIVLNNGVHDSVGGQPTIGKSIKLTEVALACGYVSSIKAQDDNSLSLAISKLSSMDGPNFIEIAISPGNRKGIGRPTSMPHENKELLMRSLSRSS